MNQAVERDRVFNLKQFSTRRDDVNESGYGPDDLGLVIDEESRLKGETPRDASPLEDLGAEVFINEEVK